MIYIFCDSDNGVTTPGTLYQTSAAWPANSDRWSSIANAIANTTIQGLADDLTFFLQGATDFGSFNTGALTSALSVLVEGNAVGAVWDEAKATCIGSAGGGTAHLSLAVPQTLRNIQLRNTINTGTPRGVYCNGSGACYLEGVKIRFTGATPNGGSGVTGTTVAGAVTARNCIVDVVNANSAAANSGISLQSATVGNFYNCVFRGAGTGATNGDNMVNCAFFGFATQGGASGNYKYCATVNNTGTNPVTVSDWNAAFQDYANFDYRLKAGSPLIGAGIGPTGDASVPTTDIAGNTRLGTITDVGAAIYVALGPRRIRPATIISAQAASMAGTATTSA